MSNINFKLPLLPRLFLWSIQWTAFVIALYLMCQHNFSTGVPLFFSSFLIEVFLFKLTLFFVSKRIEKLKKTIKSLKLILDSNIRTQENIHSFIELKIKESNELTKKAIARAEQGESISVAGIYKKLKELKELIDSLSPKTSLLLSEAKRIQAQRIAISKRIQRLEAFFYKQTK